MAIALVTTDAEFMAGDPDVDMPSLISALSRVGVEATAVPWADPATDWHAYDLVVLRSPWDYTQRFDEFAGWLERTAGQTRLLNCPELVRWNWDKRYLAQLHERGVPVVDTRFVSHGDDPDSVIGAMSSPRIVVKPAVSAGAQDTGLFDHDDPGATALAGRIVAGGRVALVQPELPAVTTAGETAVMYLGGGYSHSARKGPILEPGGGLRGGTYIEIIEATEPTDGEFAVAEATMAAVAGIHAELSCGCGANLPLYARIDIAEAADGPVVLEAELVEPNLFLRVDPSAPDRFAAAISRVL